MIIMMIAYNNIWAIYAYICNITTTRNISNHPTALLPFPTQPLDIIRSKDSRFQQTAPQKF